jgi:hypothetical protein
MTRQPSAVLCLGLFLMSLAAMSHAARAQSMSTDPTAVMNQMTNIPYFTLRDGMSSTLTLQNLSMKPAKVQVTIFNAAGQAHMLDPITVNIRSFKEVHLADVAPSGFDFGNIEVAFNGTPMMVTSQVSVFSLESRVSFESRESDMTDFESTKLAGIVLIPKGGNGYLAVTNVANNRVSFELTASTLRRTVALSPRETQVIKLNDDELISPTLIKLEHSGMPGDLIATGYVLNMKNGYSSAFTLFDPGIARSSVLAGAHFRAGRPDPGERFPGGTHFLSPLLLANISASPVTAQISVDYTVRERIQMTNIDPNKADATEDESGTVFVKTLTIAPGEVQRVELTDALVGVGQIAEAGVDITYDASPGSVIGQLTSVDESGDYAFEVPVKDPNAINATRQSTYPWSIENGTKTVLHMKNTTKETVEAGARISFAGGSYQLDKLTLKPYQTIAVDIQNLKDSQKADVLGHVFPPGATHGEVDWFQITPYSMIGRAESTDVEAGIARSFSCYTDCCGAYEDDYVLSPNPMNGTAGGSQAFSATEYYHDCIDGDPYFQFPNKQSEATSWSSSVPSVATVSSTGNTSFVAAGATQATANFSTEQYYLDDNSICRGTRANYTAYANVNVNPPDHVKVIVDNEGFPAQCITTGVYARQMQMQLVDSNGNSVTIPYSVQEAYTNLTTNTCNNGTPVASSCTATASGVFLDSMSVTKNQCNSGIAQSSGCGFNLTSTWSMCSNGMTNNVWTSTRATKSNSVLVNNQATIYNPGTQLH